MRFFHIVSLSAVFGTACAPFELIDLGGDAGTGGGDASVAARGGAALVSGEDLPSDAASVSDADAATDPPSYHPISYGDAAPLACASGGDAGAFLPSDPGDSGFYSVPLPGTGSPGLPSDGWILFDDESSTLAASVYAIHPDGTGLRLVSSGPTSEMVVSPDGSTFAATSTQGTSQTRQIFLFPVSGGSTQLTSMSADADQPAFSPDGKSIAFHSANSIYVINVDGTGLRPVVVSSDPVAFGFDYEHPTFTPDGSRIIVDRENEIESFDLAGGERPIVGNFTGEEVYPAVSRDGLELAFITDVGCYPNQGAYRVALTALDGFLPHPCEACWGSGSNLGVLTHPSWGPRGLLVLSHVSNDGVKRLVVLDTTNPSAVPVEILPQRGDQLNPVWAPGTLNLP